MTLDNAIKPFSGSSEDAHLFGSLRLFSASSENVMLAQCRPHTPPPLAQILYQLCQGEYLNTIQLFLGSPQLQMLWKLAQVDRHCQAERTDRRLPERHHQLHNIRQHKKVGLGFKNLPSNNPQNYLFLATFSGICTLYVILSQIL